MDQKLEMSSDSADNMRLQRSNLIPTTWQLEWQRECWLSIYDQILDIIQRSKLPQRINHCLIYSTLQGGKFLRPVVGLALAEDLIPERLMRKNRVVLLELMSRVELLHAASLVHDDLPALDNDDFRRGKPSAHRAFSEETALLAGNIMMSLALRASTVKISRDLSSNIAAILADANIELCVGQHIEANNLNYPENTQSHVAEAKTGSLFKCVFKLVASVIESCDLAKHDLSFHYFENTGRLLGLLFQYLDDIQDGELHLWQNQVQHTELEQSFWDQLSLLYKLYEAKPARISEVLECIGITREWK
jgi:farnesyl diphosphate synthase